MIISIPHVPPKATSQQKGATFAGGRARFFKKGHVAKAEAQWLWMIKSYMPPVEDGCEGAYHKGPLSVVVVLRYPYPARLSAKARTGEPLIPCDTRPDLDNLSKMILDAIGKAGVWRDDGQVASLTLQKFWSAEPGVYIQIEHIREL